MFFVFVFFTFLRQYLCGEKFGGKLMLDGVSYEYLTSVGAVSYETELFACPIIAQKKTKISAYIRSSSII